MGRQQYRIDAFVGINQSVHQNSLNSCFSPDACNMDTENGNLRVAKGYVRHIPNPVTGNFPIYRMTTFTGPDGVLQYLVFTDRAIYASRGTSWEVIYQYANQLANPTFDFVQAKINSVDYLLIACGERQMLKYDGEAVSLFGSHEMLSDETVLYVDIYKSRLFSAGNPSHPNRLYWSKLPGDTRSIEDWRSDVDSVNVEGGHTEIGSTSNDPIVAVHAMSNQLLIFKKHGLYRLLGDKPSNFTIEKVDATFNAPSHTAIVPYGDSLVFLTDEGICSFNGVTVRRLGDADYIKDILKKSYTFDSRGAYCDGKFYFTLRENKPSSTNALIEYDPIKSAYMIRRGFFIADIHTSGNNLLLINNSLRYVFRFNEGNSYDGVPIEAWWKTPKTDLLDKTSIKAMRTLAFYGSSDTNSHLKAEVTMDEHTDTYSIQLKDSDKSLKEFPLKNEGRAMSLKFFNENGGDFFIDGGVELLFEKWRRCE